MSESVIEVMEGVATKLNNTANGDEENLAYQDASGLRKATETVKAMAEALEEGRRAIGDHIVPEHCYATGPLTGNDYRDLVECPACSFIAAYDSALSAYRGEQK